MKKRSVAAVLLLPFITFGIYTLYWMVKTKGEMNEKGANIPTAWLVIVPFVNIWWMWKYSQGVEHVTGGKMSGVLAFILLWLLGFIGSAIIQDSFNSVADMPATAATVDPAAVQQSTEVPVADTAVADETTDAPAPAEAQPVAPTAETTATDEQTPPPAAPTVSG